MKQQLKAVHYTDNYILNPQHPITVNLIGCGGTGSQVLTGLARLNHALKVLEHPGIHVTAWDPDVVTEANIGRQAFAPADLHSNKADTLITRINRFYGYDWKARPDQYVSRFLNKEQMANIVVSCVDSATARLGISESPFKNTKNQRPYTKSKYWLDFGNTRTAGQVVLGTVDTIDQNGAKGEITANRLPTIVEMFPDIARHDTGEEQGPSCSFAEAIQRQDLFINSGLCQLGMNLLWKLFREGKLSYHGAYLNMDLLISSPMPIFVTRTVRNTRTVIKKKKNGTKPTRRISRRR